MKRLLIASWLLLAGAVGAKAEQLSFSDFSHGINSFYDPLSLAENEVQDALNVYFDEGYAASTRDGFSVCGSTKAYSFTGLWSYNDAGNNAWLITRASDTIVASNQGCTFNVRIATVTASDIVNAVNAQGNIYFVDRTNGVYFWNGSSTTYITGSPRGELIAQFRGRIWVAGLAHPNGNRVYGSKFLDGTNWTLGSNPSDPVIVFADLNDSYDNVTALFSGYNDAMQIFKNRSIFALYGFDQVDFQLRVLTREAGCTDQRSIQPMFGGLVFASERGVELFDGVNVQTPPISDKIKDKTQAATVSGFSQLSWTQNSQSDFASGFVSPNTPGVSLSTAALPGSIVVSSYGAVDTDAADWNLGTSSNISVTSSIEVSTNNAGSFADSGFEGTFSTNFDGPANTTNGPAFDTTETLANSGSPCTINPQAGSQFLRVGETGGAAVNNEVTAFAIQLIDISSNVIDSKSIPITTTNCNWVSDSFSSSVAAGKRVYFRFYWDANVDKFVTTKASYIFGGPVSYYYACARTGVTGDMSCSVDTVSGGSSTITSANFTSRVFDTGLQISTAVANVGWTIDDSTPSFELQTAVTNTGPWTVVTRSTGTDVTINRYLRYVSSFTTSPGDANSSIDDVTIIVHSSGTFYSAVKNAPGLTSWSSLTVNKSDNGGTHSFFMRSSTNPFTILSATPVWVSQGANATISIATGTYFQVRDDFKISDATHTPTLDDFSVAWFEGSRRPSMASITRDKHYYLSLATTSANAYNDTTLVLSPGPSWTVFDIRAASYVNHRGTIFHGNNQDNGAIYTDFIGTNDAGNPISAFVKTREMILGDITKVKKYDSLYVLSRSLSSTSLDIGYQVDRSTTTYSLISNLNVGPNEGLSNQRVPFQLARSKPNTGRTLSLRFSNGDLDEKMKFIGGILNYQTRKTE